MGRNIGQEIFTSYTMPDSPCVDVHKTQSLCLAAMVDLDMPPKLSRGRRVGMQRQEVLVGVFKSLLTP